MVATREQEQAKHPVTVVAGPYGHPFHPILVTVPIGTWIGSFVFDLASRWSGEPEVFAKGSFWLIGLGILGALAAALFGLLDLVAIPRSTAAFRTGLLHMAINLLVVAAFVVSFVVRTGSIDDPGEVSVGLIVLSAVALGALGLSGWLGGKLTYKYGVRVANEHDQASGYTHA